MGGGDRRCQVRALGVVGQRYWLAAPGQWKLNRHIVRARRACGRYDVPLRNARSGRQRRDERVVGVRQRHGVGDADTSVDVHANIDANDNVCACDYAIANIYVNANIYVGDYANADFNANSGGCNNINANIYAIFYDCDYANTNTDLSRAGCANTDGGGRHRTGHAHMGGGDRRCQVRALGVVGQRYWLAAPGQWKLNRHIVRARRACGRYDVPLRNARSGRQRRDERVVGVRQRHGVGDADASVDVNTNIIANVDVCDNVNANLYVGDYANADFNANSGGCNNINANIYAIFYDCDYANTNTDLSRAVGAYSDGGGRRRPGHAHLEYGGRRSPVRALGVGQRQRLAATGRRRPDRHLVYAQGSYARHDLPLCNPRCKRRRRDERVVGVRQRDRVRGAFARFDGNAYSDANVYVDFSLTPTPTPTAGATVGADTDGGGRRRRRSSCVGRRWPARRATN